MRPFAPIRSSVWLRGPKVGSIVGTEWLETIPTASGPNLTLRRKGPGNELHSASTELRSPLCIGRARPMHTDDRYHPDNRCCRQRASTVDVDPTSWGHAGHRRRRLWMDSQFCSSVGDRREVDRFAYRSIESTQWTSQHALLSVRSGRIDAEQSFESTWPPGTWPYTAEKGAQEGPFSCL